MLLLFKNGSSLSYCQNLLYAFKWLSLYSIILYIGITASMSLTVSTCVVFNSVMQSVIGRQFLVIKFFILLGFTTVSVLLDCRFYSQACTHQLHNQGNCKETDQKKTNKATLTSKNTLHK